MSSFKTKETNTFRFKSFGDRVNEIDIRKAALYYIGHENEELPECDESYFHQTLKKWIVLNLSEEYNSFSKKCMNIVTLPQLLHKKDFVIDLILEKLSTATNLSLQPLLELLVVLGKDLREEFYHYFQRVLDRLICLLNTQDADQLEWTLICLAFLFKTLKPFLKRNVEIIFNSILPLLDERRYSEQVTNFAVECFSFIARDIKDYQKLLQMVLVTVQREKMESVQGCGRLFFEIVRGVSGRFHSVAELFLKFLFQSLSEEEKNHELLLVIVQSTVANILKFVQPHNMTLFWKTLCDVLVVCEKPTANSLISVQRQVIEFHDGKFICELDTVVATILKVYDIHEELEVLQSLSKLSSGILLSKHAKVTQLDTSRLIKKAMAVEERELFEKFVADVYDHPQFEVLVLPEVLKYFEKFCDEQSIEFLAKIVCWKSPLGITGDSGDREWKQYPLLLRKKETLQKLHKEIKDVDPKELSDKSLLLVLLAPHFVGLDKEILQSKLPSACLEVCRSDVTVQKRLFAIALLLEACVHLELQLQKDLLTNIVDTILPLCADNILALHILNHVIKCNKSVKLQESQIREKLSNNLLSPYRKIRLLTAQCLMQVSKKNLAVYETFFKAESIESTVYNYREQLLLLQNLEPGGEFFKNITEKDIKIDCLKFLLGFLYHNFKLLWEPTTKLIEEYCTELGVHCFWDIYKEKLIETNKALTEANNDISVANAFSSDSLNELFKATSQTTNRVNYVHYRNQLWGKIPSFGNLSEVKNRELIPMFLDFVNSEYRKQLEQKMLTWNVSNVSEKIKFNEDGSDSEDEVEEKPARRKKGAVSTKGTVETLLTKLGMFSHQPNPKALYREPELHEFYLELLSGTNTALQKAALDCIMAYKNQKIAPYKEHLYAMIDEKKFKEELVNFKIERESGVIHPDHRSDCMQLVLRILYGKMLTKTTQKTVGSSVRKGIVLRFLGHCEKDEIFWFLRMAFGNYGHYLNGALEDIPKKVESTFNAELAWSPRKLQSAINLLEMIRQQFGGCMDQEFLTYMLGIVAFVGAACNEIIFPKSGIEATPKVVSIYKTVKNLALISLVNFFNHFEGFPWEKDQVRLLTDIFVWGNLEKLKQDSIHSPTPLLKLLLQWSRNPKFYQYLVQEQGELKPIASVIELLLNDRAKMAVRKQILEAIERLLNVQSEEEAVSGVDVLRPYISQILKRLKMNFSMKSARRGIEKRDLNILSMLTNYVEDPSTCDSLLQLLLPIMIAKSQNSTSEEVVCQVITTLSNLIKRLDQPEEYIRKVAPLFEQVQEVTARKMLCQLLTDIAKKQKGTLTTTARIVSDLNAWDRRWVEQPDYDKRLDALRTVTELLEKGEVGLDLGVLVIYNCFYFVKYDKDMGLRDNACEHLKLLAPKLVQSCESSKKDLDYLVGDVLLNLVRRTIRDNNDNVRNEGIALLGELARKCPNAHQILEDLNMLTDSLDPEVDFFENVTHLQSHRHGRALLKFCSVAKTLKTAPHFKTLTQFILPLTSRYLCSEKFVGKHTLIDAAIDTVGVVCQLLAWTHYQAILKFYLHKMRTTPEHQKQCVRIVVSILDAFHFDLTCANKAKAQAEVEVKAQDSEEKPEEAKIVHEEQEEEEEEEEADQNDVLDAELNDIPKDEACVMGELTVLAPTAAKKVVQTITSTLIPTLNHSITEKSSYDKLHKVNRKKFSFEREEEQILRVPIALAMVKLLQKLPKEVLENSLPGVFMKVCTFLKSPLKSVRMLTRDILRKIMLTIGAEYLSLLLDHLTTLLTRGFQVHVLAVTVHGVLDALKESLKPGNLEACLQNILEVCLNDIFGEISAEKDIEKIGSHTPEAKPSAKSFLVFYILARNIQESCLLDLLVPFKDHLARSQSRKMVIKIQDCFQRIVTGLVDNANISLESILIFVYGTISESITDLLPGVDKKPLTEKEKEKMRRSRPDCFIIPEAPRSRGGVIRKNVKTNSTANAHILIEFGLEMLHTLLKRRKLNDIDYEPFLAPLLPLLRDSLQSNHVRTTTLGLKCFTSIWNNEFTLPTLQDVQEDVVKRIFQVLHSNSTFGTTKQDDNFFLVSSAFKAVVALLRKCESYELNEENIAQLLLYIEADMNEGQKQPMAFSLLKAIVTRKISTTQVHEILTKVSEISITSESDFARDEARTIVFTYVMEYNLKKKVESILKFYTMQLNFSLPSGRTSALKFINEVIRKFPPKILANKAEFLYLSLGARLINEELPECRLAIAECIELLLSKLDKPLRQKLFDMTLLFFDAKKPSVREMASCLCSRFVAYEKVAFEPRVKELLPILVSKLSVGNPNAPGRFVRPLDAEDEPEEEDEEETEESTFVDFGDGAYDRIEERKQRARDHELIQTQNCILKILEFCPNVITNEEISISLDELAYQCQKFLAYDHEWVRINSARLLSLIMAGFDFEYMSEVMQDRTPTEPKTLDYIYSDPHQHLKGLVLDLCAQLVPGESNQKMVDECIKLIMFVANMVKDVKFQHVKKDDKEEGSDGPRVHLYWIIKRLRFVINNEISIAPHSSVLREAIFNWIEGLITIISDEAIVNLAPALLSALVREMSEDDQNIEAKLRHQAIRVGSKLRKRIGSEVYDKLRAAAQTKLMMRRADRKRKIAQEKINDPELAAKRKAGVQERKKVSKKRKADVMRGKAEGKKKRKRKVDEDLF